MSQEVEHAVEDDPLSRAAEIHERSVDAQRRLDLGAAEALAREAVTLFRAHAGSDHPDTANALAQLGDVLRDADRLAEAEPAILEARRILDPDFAPLMDPGDVETLGAIAAMRAGAAAQLVDVLRRQGRLAEGRAVADEALARAVAELGPGAAGVADLRVARGVIGKYAGHFDDAERDYREALAVLEGHDPPDLLALATLWHNLGGLAHERGDLAAAEPAARRAVELRREVLGPEHPAAAADFAALAPILAELGRLEEAEAALREARQALVAAHGPDHHEVAMATYNLAGVRLARGALDEALGLFEEAVATFARLATETPDHALALGGLGVALDRQGRSAEAIAMLERAVAMLERAGLVADAPRLSLMRDNLARARE